MSYTEKDTYLDSSVAIRVGTNAEGAEAAEGKPKELDQPSVKHRAADGPAVLLLCKRYVQLVASHPRNEIAQVKRDSSRPSPKVFGLHLIL